MLNVKNLFNVFALSTVMFGAGATVATVALSYLPSVIAAPGVVVGGIKQSKAEQVVEQDGLKWELQNCRRASQKVICNFLVTNVGQKDTSAQFETSRIIDLSGNQYTTYGGQIGNSVLTTLIVGIPTKASVSFELPQETTKFAVLELSLYGYNKLQFRDVSVSGPQASNPSNPGNCTCPPRTNPKKPRGR